MGSWLSYGLGSESNDLICYTDLYATVANVVKKPLPVDAAEDSFSFYDLFDGKKEHNRPPVIHSNGGLESIIYGNWKYINGRIKCFNQAIEIR